MSADEAGLRAAYNTAQLVRDSPDGAQGYSTAVHVKIVDGRTRYSAILTAAHAVETKARARQIRAVFSGTRRVIALDPDRLYISCAPRLDLAVVALAANVARAPSPLYRGDPYNPPQQRLAFWHHGGGAPRIRLGGGLLLIASHEVFVLDAHGTPGASGSGIYTADWELYGVLYASNHLLRRRTFTRVVEGCLLGPLHEALRRRRLRLA